MKLQLQAVQAPDQIDKAFAAIATKRLRLLWISYQWLSDNPNPAEVVAHLRDKEIARQLMTDTYSATIHDRGTVEAELFV